MRARTFYQAVTVDEVGALEQIARLLDELQVEYCIIGGQGVNAYVEPLVSLDLDIVVAAQDVARLLDALPPSWRVEQFPNSVNLAVAGSDLRVQLQIDPRCQAFTSRAAVRDVLGTAMRVAAIEDVLAGKVWAAADTERRASKRQKDLADIARLIEANPALRSRVPQAILNQLV
jgi:hypothetical protein